MPLHNAGLKILSLSFSRFPGSDFCTITERTASLVVFAESKINTAYVDNPFVLFFMEMGTKNWLTLMIHAYRHS